MQLPTFLNVKADCRHAEKNTYIDADSLMIAYGDRKKRPWF